MQSGDQRDNLSRGPDDDRLDAWLEELKQADPPPAGLVREVLAHVQRRQRGIHRRQGDVRMAKKALIGLAAAAALFIGVFVTTGWPPMGGGTEGSIGAARRHQAQQMSASDVKLGDAAAQDVLQSEEVTRLMNDPEARALMADAGVREALSMAHVREALANAEVREALTNGAVRLALDNARVVEAAVQPSVPLCGEQRNGA